MTKARLISYFRVSPGSKDKSRLGLEAQRKAIARFVDAEDFTIEAEHTETCKSSVGLKRRPVLVAALAEAKARQCSIVVAKLDRLSRDVAFITYLIARGVPVLVTDLGGDAKPFTLHPYPTLIKSRISKAPDGLPPVAARMTTMRANGMTLRAIAESLNAEGLRAPAGGLWQAAHVHRVLSRNTGTSTVDA